MPLSDRKKAQLQADLDKADVLQAGELLLDSTTGLIEVHRAGGTTKRRGTVVATDRRVILFSKRLGGHDVQDIAYRLLTSVDHRSGLTMGGLDFAASGDRFVITSVARDEAKRIAQVVREQLARVHQPPPPPNNPTPPPPPSQPDAADQIRRLAELRDEGLLTEEEFGMKKRQILGL